MEKTSLNCIKKDVNVYNVYITKIYFVNLLIFEASLH